MKKTIFVYGDEAALVRRANEIGCTSVNGSVKRELYNPIEFEEGTAKDDFETAEAYRALTVKYADACGTDVVPELIAADMPSPESSDAPDSGAATEEDKPLDLISAFKSPNAIYAPQSEPIAVQNMVSATPSSFAPPRPREIYTCKRSAPTAMELAKLYLSSRTVCVIGSDIYMWNNNYYTPITRPEVKRDLVRVLRDKLEIKGNGNQLNEIIEFIISEPTIEPTAEQRMIPPNLVNVGNGVLYLKDSANFELYKPMPQRIFTSAIRVPWQGEMPCRVFDNFVTCVANGDAILTERIWETLGYLLSEDNYAKRFVLLLGPSNSGKSVFGNVVSSFFDDKFISAVPASGLGAQFSLAALKDARINMAMDLTDAALSPQAVGIIKSITGRDAVSVEEKYAPVTRCRLNCKLLFSSNHVLRLMSSDHALLQRILLIPFANPIPKERQDPYLEGKIQHELPGILHKAMQAYCRLCANGYIFAGDDIYTPEMMSQAALGLDRSVTPEDVVCDFLREMCIPASSDSYVTIGQLYGEYCAYAEENNGVNFSNAQTFARTLGRSLAKMGLPSNSQKKSQSGKTVNVYYGIQMKEGEYGRTY